MEGDKGTVCVTGGTGFVASWLVMKLLERGYSVRATVRSNPECQKDVSYLTNLPGASERLQIFNADLDKPDSFDAAIEGCIGVFHVAHPIDFQNKEPEEIVTKRAVNGTIGILKACLNSKTVKRVVYTSSASAVVYDKKDVAVVDESAWSDIDLIRALKPFGDSYAISKTITEREALEFAEKHGLDLVTLIPSIIVGPFICPNLPGSVSWAVSLILGKQDEFKDIINIPLVHIDDVASAHIFLLECPNVKGRYICSSDNVTIDRLYEFLSTKFPDSKIPTIDIALEENKDQKRPRLSAKKLLDSGFQFKHGLDEMYDGAIKCCKEKGFL